MKDSGIFRYSKRTEDHEFGDELELCREFLYSFSEHSNFSHRTFAQTIHHLGLVFASLPKTHFSFAFTTVALLIIRTINIDAYRSFIEGKINDLELIEELLNTSIVRNWERIEHIDYLESLVILSYIKCGGSSLFDKTDTPLQRKYRKILVQDKAIDNIDEMEKTHAERVTKAFDKLSRNPYAIWPRCRL